MDREFLKSLELEDDAVEKIMAEHGKSIQSTKSDLVEAESTAETLQEQLDQRDSDFKELQDQIEDDEDLKMQLKELQENYDTETEELQNKLAAQRKDATIDLEITKSGARNPKAVKALLDADAVKVNDDGVHGLKDQIETLQESDAYLFEAENKPSGQSTVGGNPSRKSGQSKPNAFSEAAKKFTKN